MKSWWYPFLISWIREMGLPSVCPQRLRRCYCQPHLSTLGFQKKCEEKSCDHKAVTWFLFIFVQSGSESTGKIVLFSQPNMFSAYLHLWLSDETNILLCIQLWLTVARLQIHCTTLSLTVKKLLLLLPEVLLLGIFSRSLVVFIFIIPFFVAQQVIMILADCQLLLKKSVCLSTHLAEEDQDAAL